MPPAGLSAEEASRRLTKVAQVLQLGLDLKDHRTEELSSAILAGQSENQKMQETVQGLLRQLDDLRDERAVRNASQQGLDMSELLRRNEDLQSRLGQAETEKEDAMAENMRQKDSLRRADEQIDAGRKRIMALEQELKLLQEEKRAIQERAELDAQRQRDAKTGRTVEEELRQRTYEVRKLLRDNQELDEKNQELLRRNMTVQQELDEVSRVMLKLKEAEDARRGKDDDAHGRVAAAEARVQELEEENRDLRGEVTLNMRRFEDMEATFARNYRMWENERASLRQQIEALNAVGAAVGAGGAQATPGRPARRPGDSSGDSTLLDNVEALQEALREAQQQVLFFMEAYEALEKGLGQEIDKALAAERQGFQEAKVKARVLEDELRKERERTEHAVEQLELAQADLREAEDRRVGARPLLLISVASALCRPEWALGFSCRNERYERGYNLTDAVAEIKQWKGETAKKDRAIRELIDKVNKFSDKAGQLVDENRLLRDRAGVSASDVPEVQLGDLRLRQLGEINQLRALVSHLEWELQQREEMEVKLRNELRYRVKWSGREAAKLGLNEYQVALIEETIESLKNQGYGSAPERRVLTKMERRIQFLEQRLRQFERMESVPEAYRSLIPYLLEEGAEDRLTGPTGPEVGLGWAERIFVAKFLEELAEGVNALEDQMLGLIQRTGPDLESKGRLEDGLRKVTSLLSSARGRFQEAQAEQQAAGGTDPVSQGLEGLQRLLREQATELGALRAQVLERETILLQVVHERDFLSEVVRGSGIPTGGFALTPVHSLFGPQGTPGTVPGVIPGSQPFTPLRSSLVMTGKAGALTVPGTAGGFSATAQSTPTLLPAAAASMTPQQQHQMLHDLELQNQSLKLQLVGCLADLQARDRELSTVQEELELVHSRLQQLLGQRALLYREHARLRTELAQEQAQLTERAQRAEAESEDLKVEAGELRRLVELLKTGDNDALKVGPSAGGFVRLAAPDIQPPPLAICRGRFPSRCGDWRWPRYSWHVWPAPSPEQRGSSRSCGGTRRRCKTSFAS